MAAPRGSEASLLKKSLSRGDRRKLSDGNVRTYSVENIQSLSAAYTCPPPYRTTADLIGSRSKTLGRISTSSTGAPRKRHFLTVGSSPNLAMANTAQYPADDVMKSINTTIATPLNGSRNSHTKEPKMNRGSASDYILQVQQENESLRQEIDIKESKLQSNMNSIKNFWSPELKKERTLRKEENSRVAVLKEQLKAAQEENQNSQMQIQAYQDELHTQQDLNQLLQDDMNNYSGGSNQLSSLPRDTRILQEELDRYGRENELLQRTMEEMEGRIEAQRQTLEARDESIRKLLEMLQNKALSKADGEEKEIDVLRLQLMEADARLAEMDSMVMEKNVELLQLKQEMEKSSTTEEKSQSKILKTVVDMKDAKINSLELEIKSLESEITKLKRSGDSSEERQEELKQLEVYKNHSQFMKNKIEQLKSDVQKKDTVLVTMQTKLDALNNQQSDNRQHIDVLKESLTAKEQRAAILQAEVDSLRARLDEKQQILDRKLEQLSGLQEERSTSGSEVAHLRDTLEVKDRKIAVLHRKIESLAEVVREKDKQIDSMKDRLMTLQQDSSTSDSALSTMEEALTEKEKANEKLRQELATAEETWRGHIDELEKERKELDDVMVQLKQDLADKETSLNDLKEHASSLASEAVKKDSKIKHLEIDLQQKSEEITKAELQSKKGIETLESENAQHLADIQKVKQELQEKINDLAKKLKNKDEESARSQTELDRLLEILRQTENEKHDKDKKIISQDKLVKELQAKVKSLKDKMDAESKHTGAVYNKNTEHLVQKMKSKDDRIEELEEALRESVSITRQRELVLTREQEHNARMKKQLEDFVLKHESQRKYLSETGTKLNQAEAVLQDKEACLQKLRSERRSQLMELLEIKQEALLSAISEKDANIALLELSNSRKKTNVQEVQALKVEKDKLVAELKQQTQNRLKLVQDEPQQEASTKSRHNGNKKNKPLTHKNRTSPTEDDGQGIWA